MEITLIIILLFILIIFQIIILIRNPNKTGAVLDPFQDLLKKQQNESRSELSTSLLQNREELANNLERLSLRLEQRLSKMQEINEKSAWLAREEMTRGFNVFRESFTASVNEFNTLQKHKFEEMTKRQDALIQSTEKKLEEMRVTVDEKLHKTLEERLSQSFKQVSERLEAVQKGLGEMQTLASGVGDLKKVLTNVKTRGVLGEIQLGNILEQIMAPEQYESNVRIKPHSADNVEFAIKLPGKDNSGEPVYLPIDAKFPQEDYLRLYEAYEQADKSVIETETRNLAASIKKSAKDIRDKYIHPPHTTDFAIMFLPVEGLYAEIVRQPALITQLQNEFKVIITGPTTLAAMLNSLQMGFKTLAIQKRSSEVWEVLASVKKQFGEFGKVLKKAQDRIRQANDEIETLVTTRTNVMMSKLKNIDALPQETKTEIEEENTDM